MGKRIVEGLWDCSHCGRKGVSGLKKSCPSCGHPQDEDVKFYLGEEIKYLDEQTAEGYGKGADWVCPYCNSLNRVNTTNCVGCGAAKDSSEMNYFTSKAPQPAAPIPQKNRKKRWLIILGVIFVLFAALLVAFWPRTYEATVTDAAWTRAINIEAYRTVQESDWSVPEGGRIRDKKTEIHHYEDVLDHYETRTRQVAESVFDGYDYETSYSDNGDGTFTENTISVPRYRTEYRTETYQEPVYRQEPRYATKYYYDIDKWVTDRTEKAEGSNDDPYWPSFDLAENERKGPQTETYILKFQTEKKGFEAVVPFDLWKKYSSGNKVEITVVGGNVSKISGEYISD